MSRAFTNDIVGGEIILDQYAVEDLVQFQGTTFKVLEGLHQEDGFNIRISSSIERLFIERLESMYTQVREGSTTEERVI